MSVRTPDPDWNPGDEPVVRPPANPGWLSDLELAEVRGRLPLLYVEAVPVRVDGLGQVTEIGMPLRANAVGEMTRTLVSGRVMYGETIRDALFRHLENDLGPMAFPMLPPQPVPFTVAEYFPIPFCRRISVGWPVQARNEVVSELGSLGRGELERFFPDLA